MRGSGTGGAGVHWFLCGGRAGGAWGEGCTEAGGATRLVEGAPGGREDRESGARVLRREEEEERLGRRVEEEERLAGGLETVGWCGVVRWTGGVGGS